MNPICLQPRSLCRQPGGPIFPRHQSLFKIILNKTSNDLSIHVYSKWQHARLE